MVESGSLPSRKALPTVTGAQEAQLFERRLPYMMAEAEADRESERAQHYEILEKAKSDVIIERAGLFHLRHLHWEAKARLTQE